MKKSLKKRGKLGNFVKKADIKYPLCLDPKTFHGEISYERPKVSADPNKHLLSLLVIEKSRKTRSITDEYPL